MLSKDYLYTCLNEHHPIYLNPYAFISNSGVPATSKVAEKSLFDFIAKYPYSLRVLCFTNCKAGCFADGNLYRNNTLGYLQ